MSKKIIGMGTAFLLPLTAAVLLIWGLCLPPVYEDTFLGELKYKWERLKTTEGKRLIIAGGSAAAFGVDSELLRQELPEYEPVNFGMYAGLGNGLILDLLEDEIREGDLIVFMPEQDEQTLSDYFDASCFWQAADGAYEMVLKADKAYRGQILAGFPAFAGEKMRYFLQGEKPSAEGVYTRAAFDAYGDLTALCEGNRMPQGIDMTQQIVFRPEMISDDLAEKVRRFARKAQRKGAYTVYHFCPMNLGAAAEKITDGYLDTLEEKMGLSLIGDPSECLMEPGWFYDTNFHLNSSGKTVFTDLLIRDLKAQLLDCSPTEIRLPEMPEAVQREIFAGDASDADCFICEITDGQAILTGLTQKGKEKKLLILPDRMEGMPVKRLPAGLLAGAENAEEIRIQKNIEIIDNGAFDGMEKLRRIVIENGDPRSVAAGRGLLDGCAADLYVPKEALTKYRLDYTFSTYASRIRPADE